jgi:hypothetical protein
MARPKVGRSPSWTWSSICCSILHLAQITNYALVYYVTGAIRSVHTALYFSVATFTTIGGGKVQTEEPWQFFAALQASAGSSWSDGRSLSW